MHNQLLTNRSNIKSDRISKILQTYSIENDKPNQNSFRMLSQKIKNKIGNQISDHQKLYPKPSIKDINKMEISQLINDNKKTQSKLCQRFTYSQKLNIKIIIQKTWRFQLTLKLNH